IRSIVTREKPRIVAPVSKTITTTQRHERVEHRLTRDRSHQRLRRRLQRRKLSLHFFKCHLLEPWISGKQLIAARAGDRNRDATARCSRNEVAVDAVNRRLIESESDLLDSVSDLFATHDDTRVIGAEKLGCSLRLISLIDVLPLGFEADRESLESLAARVL